MIVPERDGDGGSLFTERVQIPAARQRWTPAAVAGGISLATAIFTLLVGGTVLLGWIIDQPILTSFSPSWVAMKANTALAFLLLGTALLARRRLRVNRVARGFVWSAAALVLLFSLLTLLEYGSGRNLGIDQLLFHEPAGTLGTWFPGRMALHTALAFTLLSLEMLIPSDAMRWCRVRQSLILLAGLLGLLGLLGHLYQAHALISFGVPSWIAVHTAFTILVLAAGFLCAIPHCGVAALFLSDGPGGRNLRVLWPTLVVLSIGCGRLALFGIAQGNYNAPQSMVCAMVAVIVGLSMTLYRISASLEHAVRARWEAEAALLQSREAELHTVLESLSEGLVTATLDGFVQQWNRVALEMHGFSSLEEAQHSLPELATIFALTTLDGTNVPVAQWPLARVLNGEEVCEWELHIQRRNTTWERIFSYRGSLVRNPDGQPLLAVLTINDVTERKQAEARLYYQATHDQLTGLCNRALFFEHLTRVLKSARRSGEPVAVLLFDLDHFKDINDTYGHAAGDQVLTTVAERITDALRDCDTIARLGGDEFIILMTGFTEHGALQDVACRLLQTIASPIHINAQTCHMTASLGIGVFPHDATDADALIQMADTAMYQAKEQGNGYRCAECSEVTGTEGTDRMP